MKILIADDNPQITSILQTYAKKEGYETLIAVDDVLNKLEHQDFEMLLLD